MELGYNTRSNKNLETNPNKDLQKNTSWADNVESEILSDNKENSPPTQAKEIVANKGKTIIEKSQYIDYQNKHIESDKKHMTENHDDNVSQTSSSTTTNSQI